jgi:putative ABC transport system permease protein
MANVKAHLWLIEFIGLIVPRRLRADWRQEWEAELQYRELLLADWDKLNWKTKLDLLRRSLGAFWDALWLQQLRWEDEMIQDLRYGVRMLAKHPAFTFAAVLSLAIGIGANTAIFSVVNGVLLRPLPFKEPERLVRFWHDKPMAGMKRMPVSPGMVTEWRDQSHSFEGIAAYSETNSVLIGELDPEQVSGACVSANLFPVLGLQPILGRNFLAEENQKDKDHVVLLSYQLWQRRFGADPDILGRSITMDQTNTYTVIGVMAPGVRYPGRSEFWKPLTVKDEHSHGLRNLSVIARLKAGVTLAQARADLETIQERMQEQYPEDYRAWVVDMLPLREMAVGSVRPALLALFGAVGFVLLIACANVANLLLARAAARQKEIAVRAALGASRMRLIRQMLTESAVLTIVGGAAGLLLARWGVQALVALNPRNLPRLDQVNMDASVVGFTIVISVIVGLLFGLAPALQVSKTDVGRALKDGPSYAAMSGGRLRRQGLRGLLVVTQTAMAIVLLTGAGLMLKSFIKLGQVELGFEPEHALTLTISPNVNRFAEGQRPSAYYQQMIDSLKAVPGVTEVAAMTGGPLGGVMMNSPIVIAGRPAPPETESQRAFVTVISPDYFRALGAQLKNGRFFSETDTEGSPRVAIINETLAERYFPASNPAGERFSLRGEDKPYEIVGVVADIKQFGMDEEKAPALFVSFQQMGVRSMSLLVRSTAEPSTLISALRSSIWAVDKYAPITGTSTLERIVADSVALPRFYTLLFALFAAIAMILAAMGLYGVMTYAVSRRTHEIGIRLSLGAEPRRIVRMILGEGLTLILIGVGVGLASAVVLTRLMETLLFGVSATDPATFAIIALALIVVALAACYFPARRATTIDPLVALRCE